MQRTVLHIVRPRAPAALIDSLSARFPPRQVASFATVGVICTLLYAVLYHITRTWLPPIAANALAITSTAALNFLANRSHTFRVRNGPVARQAVQYFVLSVAAIGISSLVLFVFGLSWSEPSYAIEFAVALFASGLATVFRYVALTAWVFRDARTLETLPSVHTTIAPPAQAA